MEHNDFLYEDENFIDIGRYLDILRRHWKTALWFCAGGFALGCLVALGTPRKYMVTSKLAPELSSTATSRLSSMASLVGLSASMMGTTDAVYPMVYPDLVKSPEFIADLFDEPVSFTWKKERVDTTLYAYLTEYKKFSPVGFVMSLPGMAVGAVKGLFEKQEEDSADAPVNPFHFTKKQGRIAKLIGKNVKAEIDKKTLVVTTVVTMDNAEVCAQLSRAVNENIKKYVTVYRTEKAIKDCEYYEKLYEEAQKSYYAAQRAYSYYSDSHQNVSLRSYMIESERLKNEATLQFQLYTSTAQQLQAAQAKVQQETPVFAEIVPPSVPLKSANSRKKTALAFAFVGLMAGAFYVLVKNRKEED